MLRGLFTVAIMIVAGCLTSQDVLREAEVVQKGLGGGKVIVLSNRTHSQIFSAIFVSPAGRVAVVDGGLYGDAENLTAVLKSLGGTVDVWYLTHAHCDHMGALTAMMEQGVLSDEVRVKKLVFSFPPLPWLQQAEPRRFGHVRRFYAALDKAASDVMVERHAKGAVYDLGGRWTITPLNDYDLTIARPNINDTSICLSVDTAGRKWLVTGDIGRQVCGRIAEDLGPRLNHEFVFLSHHGQNGADKDFYAKVKPSVAIWPTPNWLWENDNGHGPGSGLFETNRTKCWMQDLGVRENHVLDKDVVFK